MGDTIESAWGPTCEVIDGRPDFRDHNFGVTLAKAFPPYLFSTNALGCLVHKIARVEMRWWVPLGAGHRLGRLNKPKMVAYLVCGGFRFLTVSRTRTCMVPDPGALLCGRCHGEPATFGRDGEGTKRGIRRSEAHVKLGCVVKGY